MEYEQFAKEFMEHLEKNVAPEQAEIFRHPVKKINVTLDGVSVRYPGTTAGPTIYLEEAYDLHQRGYSAEQLAKETAERFKQSIQNAPEVPKLTKTYAKENLYCAVVNAEINKDLLMDIPHEKMEDLAVIARCKVGEDRDFLVTNDICHSFHMTSEEIMEQAHLNTERQGFQCQRLEDILRSMFLTDGMPEGYVDDLVNTHGPDCPMYILTNRSTADGAVAITSAAALEQAKNSIGQDFYILPSSRHELILVPVENAPDIKALETIVRQVNSTEVSARDKLSDHVYKYDSLRKRVSIADTPSLTRDTEKAAKLTKPHTRKH